MGTVFPKNGDAGYRDDKGSSSRHRDMPLDCKVYVGDLPDRTSECDLYEHFERCGPLKNVWVARNPPGFAFVEFVDPRDAEDAVRRLDGMSMKGAKIRVEQSTGKIKQKSWNTRRGPPPRFNSRRPFNPDDRCFECQRTGHYAYDCPNVGRRSSRRRSRSRSRGRGRRSDSRSRSRSRSFSRSRSRSRSRSHDRRRRDRSRSRSASRKSDHSHHSNHSPNTD